MARTRVKPRLSRALRALIACWVLGVAAAPPAAAWVADRVVVTSESEEEPSDQPLQRLRAPCSIPSEPRQRPTFRPRAPREARRPNPPSVPELALYIEHCALLL
ncbi:MAG TPA: hypothetical protein VFZ61_23810 [Polyangiales bacterium]